MTPQMPLTPRERARRRRQAIEIIRERSKAHFESVKIPRNAPCPCGSGRKFKRCCIERFDRIYKEGWR